MAAHAHAMLDGVELLAPRTFSALLPTAATMAPPLIKTSLMAALATALKAGAQTLAQPTSPATLRTIAAPMVKLRTRTEMMVVIASAPSDGKVTVAMRR